MFGPSGRGWRTGSAAPSHKVCIEGGKKGEFQKKEIAPSEKKFGEFVNIHPTLGERRVSAHLSHFLAIKAIVFIEIQGRFGSALMATERGGIQGKLHFGVELLVWNDSVASPEHLRQPPPPAAGT